MAFVFEQSQRDLPWLGPLTLSVFTYNFVFDLFASSVALLSMPAIIVFYASLLFVMVTGALSLVKWLAAQDRSQWLARLRRAIRLDLSAWDIHGSAARHAAWVPASSFLLPLTIFVTSAVLFRNALFYRTTSPLMAPLMLWFAVGLAPHRSTVIHRLFLTALIGSMVVALLAWSPTIRSSNLLEVLEIVKREWQPGDIIYHNNDMTVILFSVYLRDEPQYVLDEEILEGGKGIVEAVKLNAPRAALEQIPHRRAWVIWARSGGASASARMDERMRAYTNQCPLVGILSYWQFAELQIFLCGDPTHLDPGLNR